MDIDMQKKVSSPNLIISAGWMMRRSNGLSFWKLKEQFPQTASSLLTIRSTKSITVLQKNASGSAIPPDLKEIFVVEQDASLTPVKLLHKHDNSMIKRNKTYLCRGDHLQGGDE